MTRLRKINSKKNSVPASSRPRMPGYGVRQSDEGLLPWSWARTRLEKAHNYYLATVRPEGAPHMMPVWGLWLDHAFYFSTGLTSRKAKNLQRSPRCVLATERADESVVVEGTARRLAARSIPKEFFSLYKKKYGWEMKGEPVYLMRPRVAFGFIEAGDDFYQTATRWSF